MASPRYNTNIAWNEAEYQQLKAAADKEGLTVPMYVKRAAMAKAEGGK